MTTNATNATPAPNGTDRTNIDDALAFIARRFEHIHVGHAVLMFDDDVTTHQYIDLSRPNRWKTARTYLDMSARDDGFLAVAVYRTNENRTEPNILHVPVLYCERDAATLHPNLPAPSYTVETSAGHYHDYWTLAEPVDVATAKAYVARIAAACGVNDAKDAARVLRLPGTVNHKPGREAYHVRVISDTGKVYDLSDFHRLPATDMTPVLSAAPMPASGERVPAATIVRRALDKCTSGGRNNEGFNLACQLRDNGYSAEETAHIGLAEYVPNVPRTTPDGEIAPYTEREWLASVKQAFTRDAREPWGRVIFTAGQATNDVANAARFAAQHGAGVRYCHKWRAWLVWDGKRWQRDETGRVVELAKATAASIYREAAEADEGERKALGQWAATSHSRQRLDAMLALTQSEAGIAVTPDMLDTHPYLLTVNNGTLDLRTGRLLDPDPAHLITKLAPVDYDANAQCPKWDEVLHTAMNGDTALLAFLARWFGYCLTGATGERSFVVAFGSGANGKSTTHETFAAIMGDYALRTPVETLTAKKGDGGVPNDVARLKGARFVYASETEEGKRLAEAFIKDVTGGDTLSARFMHAEWFDFTPECKLWLSTNHKPTIRGTDMGIWDRVKLVPFAVRIPEGERDIHLKEKLRAEYAGILAWAVRGCLAWQCDGLGVPQVVKDATEEYRGEMDVLGDFLAECCKTGPGIQATAGDLYRAYTAWCERTGEYPMKQRTFGLRLEERSFVQRRTKAERYWEGVEVLSDALPNPFRMRSKGA